MGEEDKADVGRLKILARGKSSREQAQARGRLFEKLMAEVLRHYGYSIDRVPNVNYAGMEIDIEGKHTATNIPLYAECKCYETKVDSTKLQAFYGKYITRWHKDKRCHGLFIALPSVTSPAKGFYRENIEGNPEVTVRLYEEENVMKAILGTPKVTSPDAISSLVVQEIGKPGDWLLLYTDKGIFWVQYIIPKGAGVPRSVALFDAMGATLSEKSTLDYLMQLCPELEEFDRVAMEDTIVFQSGIHKDVEEIVEVRGSSECFEYQFPASAEHFVGRQSILEELDSFVRKVIDKKTSSRGILVEANSGWGKSSIVLASVARLRKMGHFAVAIDSRSASSSQFILRVLDYAFNKFGDLGGLLSDDNRFKTITGFEGAGEVVLSVGQVLEHNGKIMFIFLDQFENVFSLPNTLKRITDMLLKICDAQVNIIIGFSWKTDLVGLTSEFPYQLRDTIMALSKRIVLDTFSEVETNALLEKLSEELRAPLRKDLKFFLSEFSQGFPWLLKKLCAHVKSQRKAGVPQLEIANSLLNIEELFQEDLRGLSVEEIDVLQRIAKVSPISVLELSEELKPEVIQSLVNRRLVVKIGSKLDIYWDIFRDYLNSGSVPIQDNYILRTSVGSVLRTTKLLADANGLLGMVEFQERAGLRSNKSLYNVVRDMRLLGLAKVVDDKVSLEIKLPETVQDFEESFRAHLKERLRRNRLVWRLLDTLETEVTLTMDDISSMLAQWCPYISARKQTWRTYAINFVDWMDTADLGIYDRQNYTINCYTPGKEVRERHLRFAKRRGGVKVPCVQYMPVQRAAIRIFEAAQGEGRIDWTGFKRSTIFKSLRTLEDLGFITRKANTIMLTPKLFVFVKNSERRSELFARAAMEVNSFKIFINILEDYKDIGATLTKLGIELKKNLGVDWKKSTCEINAKIMLDWARHTQLAPGVFAEIRKGSKIGGKKQGIQTTLFSNIKE